MFACERETKKEQFIALNFSRCDPFLFISLNIVTPCYLTILIRFDASRAITGARVLAQLGARLCTWNCEPTLFNRPPSASSRSFSSSLSLFLYPTRNPNVWLHPLRLKQLIRNFRDSRDRSAHQPAKIDFTCARSLLRPSWRFCFIFFLLFLFLCLVFPRHPSHQFVISAVISVRRGKANSERKRFTDIYFSPWDISRSLFYLISVRYSVYNSLNA